MTTLRQGDRGLAVLEVQCLLTMAGYAPGPLDGIIGTKTERAVILYHERRLDLCESDGLDMEPRIRDIGDADVAHLRALQRRAVQLPRMLTPVLAVDMRIALTAAYASLFPDYEQHRWDGEEVCSVCGADDQSDLAQRSCPRMANAVAVAMAQLCIEHGCEPWGGRQTQDLDAKGLLPRPWLQPKRGEMSYIAVWNWGVGNRQLVREHRPGGVPSVPYIALSAPEGERGKQKTIASPCYAFPNAAEGATRYWKYLSEVCGKAFAEFEAGRPAEAAHELKIGPWHFTGSEAEYVNAMVDRYEAPTVAP